jgi:trans-2-enoyl-CoA reductase
MVQALVNLDKNTNRVLNVIKAKFDLKDKSEAIKVLVDQYVLEKEPQLRPEYIAKMKKIMKEPNIHIGTIKDFEKHFEGED